MNENDFIEEIDVSKFVKDIIIHYKDGSNCQIIDPYQLNQMLSVFSYMTISEEKEAIGLLNDEDIRNSRLITSDKTNDATTKTEIKVQVLEVLKDLFSSALSGTTNTNDKEALALDQTNSQENMNNSFEGETWNEVDATF
jgi:hypothetical protein